MASVSSPVSVTYPPLSVKQVTLLIQSVKPAFSKYATALAERDVTGMVLFKATDEELSALFNEMKVATSHKVEIREAVARWRVDPQEALRAIERESAEMDRKYEAAKARIAAADQDIYDAAFNGDVELLQDFILVAPESLDLPNRDPESGDYYGYTPLIMAASEGEIAFCDILLKHGCNPNATSRTERTKCDDWISTPLSAAVSYREGEDCPERLALVKLLLKYNAEVNFTSNGWTILDNAIELNGHDFALKTHLISVGAKSLFSKEYRKLQKK